VSAADEDSLTREDLDQFIRTSRTTVFVSKTVYTYSPKWSSDALGLS
jgi:hypothetical protein